ncbi:hypothetical protein IE4872_PD01043 (plasmid) [Rhizobium gallicum]|uniref:Uncharacterized protein n=1 Tax=Rhizobium gallicum TaxID=56730 RepID=A0A1L5NUJ8_9HYPH|nr:hypothetical protein [Rhizobium gallicum]APO71570.1 hypothetical protein IE4872_PD01043 [Rhizobium gallicum]
MSLEGHTTAPGANVHENHYCDHEDASGIRCTQWGCYGFEESTGATRWYCRKHQPLIYRGLPAHGSIHVLIRR